MWYCLQHEQHRLGRQDAGEMPWRPYSVFRRQKCDWSIGWRCWRFSSEAVWSRLTGIFRMTYLVYLILGAVMQTPMSAWVASDVIPSGRRWRLISTDWTWAAAAAVAWWMLLAVVNLLLAIERPYGEVPSRFVFRCRCVFWIEWLVIVMRSPSDAYLQSCTFITYFVVGDKPTGFHADIVMSLELEGIFGYISLKTGRIWTKFGRGMGNGERVIL